MYTEIKSVNTLGSSKLMDRMNTRLCIIPPLVDGVILFFDYLQGLNLQVSSPLLIFWSLDRSEA